MLALNPEVAALNDVVVIGYSRKVSSNSSIKEEIAYMDWKSVCKVMAIKKIALCGI